ncbi:hypothetical protein [Barnesiella intestinihominis]
MIRVINYFHSIAIELMAVRDILGYRHKISYVCIRKLRKECNLLEMSVG